MSIFGNIDAKALANNVSVVQGNATVTLASGSFLNAATANYIVPGDILSLSGVQYVVKSVTSATTLVLHKVYAGTTATITAANAIRRTAPKAVAYYVINAGDSNTGSLIYIDRAEAALNENKIRGLTSPGWWVYKTYTDDAGNTRHKSECIAAVTYASSDPTVTGDFDSDNPAADVVSAVTITSTYPQNATTVSGAATFTVSGQTATTGTPGTLLYQWQAQTATSTTKWTNLTNTGIYTGSTTATLTLTGATSAVTGYKYRVKVTSDGGTEEVISRAATLTFGT
jgi:hypothetical protein